MVETRVQDQPSQAHESAALRGEGSERSQVVRVEWQGDDRFDISVRDHAILVDQPVDAGGSDAGPTPTELFVAGLASCVAFYARRYLRRHDLDPAGLEVSTSYRMGSRPTRVAEVDMDIHLATELSPQRRAGLLAQARHCTVHNSIEHAPDIEITLAQPCVGVWPEQRRES